MIILFRHMISSLNRGAVVCAILERISGFDPLLEMIDPRYLKFSTASDLLSSSFFGKHLVCLSSLSSCLDQSPFYTLWWLYQSGCQLLFPLLNLRVVILKTEFRMNRPPLLILPS